MDQIAQGDGLPSGISVFSCKIDVQVQLEPDRRESKETWPCRGCAKRILLRQFYRNFRRKTDIYWPIQKESDDLLPRGTLKSANEVVPELTRDQFITGLVSETLRVKLIRKGHRHRDTLQTHAKCFEASTSGNVPLQDNRPVCFTSHTIDARETEKLCPNREGMPLDSHLYEKMASMSLRKE